MCFIDYSVAPARTWSASELPPAAQIISCLHHWTICSGNTVLQVIHSRRQTVKCIFDIDSKLVIFATAARQTLDQWLAATLTLRNVQSSHIVSKQNCSQHSIISLLTDQIIHCLYYYVDPEIIIRWLLIWGTCGISNIVSRRHSDPTRHDAIRLSLGCVVTSRSLDKSQSAPVSVQPGADSVGSDRIASLTSFQRQYCTRFQSGCMASCRITEHQPKFDKCSISRISVPQPQHYTASSYCVRLYNGPIYRSDTAAAILMILMATCRQFCLLRALYSSWSRRKIRQKDSVDVGGRPSIVILHQHLRSSFTFAVRLSKSHFRLPQSFGEFSRPIRWTGLRARVTKPMSMR
jgi:hypothetical protein